MLPQVSEPLSWKPSEQMHLNVPLKVFAFFFCHIFASLFLFCQNWWLDPCPLSLDSSLPIMSLIQSTSSSHQPLLLAGFPFCFAPLPFPFGLDLHSPISHLHHHTRFIIINEHSGCLNCPFDKYLLDAYHCPKHCPRPGVGDQLFRSA